MFSRIQTLFLFLAITALSCTFLFPVLSGAIGASAFKFTSYGLFIVNEKGTIKTGDSYVYMVAAGALLLLLAALGQYKKRLLQLRLCRIAYLLMLIQFALYFFTFTVDEKEGVVNSHYDISFFLPLVALIFTFVAEKFIQRDENLVRSADRLR